MYCVYIVRGALCMLPMCAMLLMCAMCVLCVCRVYCVTHVLCVQCHPCVLCVCSMCCLTHVFCSVLCVCMMCVCAVCAVSSMWAVCTLLTCACPVVHVCASHVLCILCRPYVPSLQAALWVLHPHSLCSVLPCVGGASRHSRPLPGHGKIPMRGCGSGRNDTQGALATCMGPALTPSIPLS